MRIQTYACSAFLAAVVMIVGCKANAPGSGETRMVTAAKRNLFIRNKSEKNPLPNTPAIQAEGKEAYTHYCAACHGLDGQNTGVPFASRMSPPVPLLTSKDVQLYTDGQLKWILDYGIWPSGMPGSKGTLSDEELWSIIVFIRHLPPAGSLGEPEMYSH
jgi:mono/diheme cytochrome c family protein